MAAPVPTTAEVRSILMRANRLLGASLVECNLITVDQLENANEKLLELIATAPPRQCTLLGVLAYDLKVISEHDVLQYCVDEHHIGLVDLRLYDGSDDLRVTVNQPACWATWTLPFDREEDFTLVATAYYLSPAVRMFWEKQYGGQVIWYGTTLEAIAEALERLPAPRA
jgi:Type II secretion system (T2SS), protein E, N-terminal domain